MRLHSRFLLIGLLILSTRMALACSCMRPGAVCSIQMGTSTIFRGTVIEKTLFPNIMDVKRPDGTTQQLVGSGKFRVRFTVAETFSGQPQTEQVVYTNQQSSMCGFDFQMGKEYVVFSYSNNGELWTSHCTRTALLDAGSDNEAIRWMRSRATAPSGSEILGTVSLSRDSSLRTVPATVHLSGPKERSVQTDADGRYSARGLPAGDYTVSLTVPAGFSASNGPTKAAVQDKGCAEVDWYITYNGQVSGRVRDAEGQPVADLQMTLEPKDERLTGYERRVFATTMLDGTYHFDHLSPGQYLLYTRGALSLTGDSLLYFPHATEVEQAQVIEVGESTSTGGYDFTLSKLRPTTPVQVKVLEPDGSPAPPGLMLFAFPNHTANELSRTGITDASGMATLPLHSGQEYAISVAIDSNHQFCAFATKTFFGSETSTTISITSPEKCPR